MLKELILFCLLGTVAVALTYKDGVYYMITSPGYSHDQTSDKDFPNWMKAIDNKTRLCDMSIPGTHETMAVHGDWTWDILQCQSKDLLKQLNSGIRAVDFRVEFNKTSDGNLRIHHKIVPYGSLTKALKIITGFLDSNPSETVIVKVSHDRETEKSQVATAFKKILQDFNKYKYSGRNYKEVTLGELRRKIFFVKLGIDIDIADYGIFGNMENHWHFHTNWDLYCKWMMSRDFMKTTNASFGEGFFVNYLSGAVGSFPYFVASGKSSPYTNSPRLSTGLSSFTSYYPEFPRYWGSILFEGINVMTFEWLQKQKPSFVGIIMADFPGSGLIDEIIKCNHRQKTHLLSKPNPEDRNDHHCPLDK